MSLFNNSKHITREDSAAMKKTLWDDHILTALEKSLESGNKLLAERYYHSVMISIRTIDFDAIDSRTLRALLEARILIGNKGSEIQLVINKLASN